MRNRITTLKIILFFTILVLFSACKKDDKNDNTNNNNNNPPAPIYKIGMVKWAAYSPLNVAQEKGFWTEQGIKVEVTVYEDNTDLNDALMNKNIDIALDMLGSWVSLNLNGEPIKIIGETDWSNGGDKIIIKKGTNLGNMKGQNFGTYLNLLSVNYFISKYLASNALQLTDFKIKEVSDPQKLSDQFIADSLKLMANYDPAASRAITNGNGEVVATSADYPGVIPEGFAARTEFITNTPKEDLVKIFKGWIKAVQWTRDANNEQEYFKIMNEKTYQAQPAFSDAELRTFLSEVKIYDKAEQLSRNQNNGGTYNYLTDLNSFSKSSGFSTKDFQPTDVFDNAAMVQALSE